MHWTCPYCNKNFDFEKHQQKGGHITSCLDNPKQKETGRKISEANTLPRYEIFSECPKCLKEFSQFRTNREIETDRDIKIFCSQGCANSHEHTFEQREQISKALSGREYPERQIREIRNCKICEIVFECRPSYTKATCSKECVKLFLSKQLKGRTGGWRPKRIYLYKNLKLDSGWEVIFAERLDQLGVEWKSSSTEKYFPYKDLFGVMRNYFPDFYLPAHDLYIEIKGAWTPEVIHKMKDVQERNKFNLIILDKIELIKSFYI